MEQETTHEMLRKIVQQIAQEAAGYFCNEDTYCEEAGCDGVDDETQDGYCDKHNGSVLDVEYSISIDGSFIGCTVCVGTGGPHIELDTRHQTIVGSWGGEVIRKHYTESEAVAGFWEEMYENVRA